MMISKTLVCVSALMLVVLASCADECCYDQDGPRNTDMLTAPIPNNSVYLFVDAGYRGNVTRLVNVDASPDGKLPDIRLGTRISSAQWNLAPGVVVVLYQDSEGRGNQVALWGRGETPSFSQWKTNDKISEWASYHISGAANRNGAPLSPRPMGAEPTGSIALDTIELYRDRDFKGTLTAIGQVTQTDEFEFHSAGSAADKMTSLRWRLPPGALVILYQDAGGKGRQVALWGSGQYRSVSAMNFNDRVSDWAWYYTASEIR